MRGVLSSEISVTSQSRLTIGEGLARAIGVSPDTKNSELLGVFRSGDELICALRNKAGEAPALGELSANLDYLEDVADNPGLTIEHLPPLEYLVLPERVHRIEASWHSNKSQLNLKTGVAILRQLGGGEVPGRMRVMAVGGLLVIVSHERALHAQAVKLSSALANR